MQLPFNLQNTSFELTHLEQKMVHAYPNARAQWQKDDHNAKAIVQVNPYHINTGIFALVILATVAGWLLLRYVFKRPVSFFWCPLVLFAYLYLRAWYLVEKGKAFFTEVSPGYTRHCLAWLESFSEFDANKHHLEDVAKDLKNNIDILNTHQQHFVTHSLSETLLGFLSTFGLTASGLLKTTQELDALPSFVIDVIGFGSCFVLAWWFWQKFCAYEVQSEIEVQSGLRIDIRSVLQEYHFLKPKSELREAAADAASQTINAPGTTAQAPPEKEKPLEKLDNDIRALPKKILLPAEKLSQSITKKKA